MGARLISSRRVHAGRVVSLDLDGQLQDAKTLLALLLERERRR